MVWAGPSRHDADTPAHAEDVSGKGYTNKNADRSAREPVRAMGERDCLGLSHMSRLLSES